MSESDAMESKQRLLETVEILVNLVRNIRLRRELESVCADPPLNFWRLIYGDLTDIAVLEWCKLFGSDDSEKQPAHWKNIVPDRDNFMHVLLTRLNVSLDQWKSYWDALKRYRDQSVAHHDHRRVQIKSYPIFDLALLSAYFYYEVVVTELSKLGVDKLPKDLMTYGDAFADLCRDIATAAMKATESFQETVR